jgi:hypothetical protein
MVMKSSEMLFKTEAVFLGTTPENTLHVSISTFIHILHTQAMVAAFPKKAINVYSTNLQHLKHKV